MTSTRLSAHGLLPFILPALVSDLLSQPLQYERNTTASVLTSQADVEGRRSAAEPAAAVQDSAEGAAARRGAPRRLHAVSNGDGCCAGNKALLAARVSRPTRGTSADTPLLRPGPTVRDLAHRRRRPGPRNAHSDVPPTRRPLSSALSAVSTSPARLCVPERP